MFKKNKLELHAKPKPAIQINRPLIITIAIIVVTVLLFAIIGAFSTSKKVASTPTTTSAKATLTDKPLVISPELQDLPGSYTDIDSIKKFIPEQQDPRFASILQKFNDLQNDYLQLKQQMSTRGEPQETFAEDPHSAEAKKSKLTFDNLKSAVDDIAGPSSMGGSGSSDDRSRPFRSSSSFSQDQQDLVATPEQGAFFKEQERNKQKLAVMKGKDNPDDIYDLHNVVKPVSPYQLMAGTLIPTTLITGIDTTLSGTMIAQVTSNMYDTVTGKHLLIPKGSKLLGSYESRISFGQRRFLLTFERIVRPDGSSILLGKPIGVDDLGQAGAEGNVDNHWARIIGAATIGTIFSVGAGLASDNVNNNNNQFQSYRARALLGGGSNLANFGQNFANRSMDIPPTITLPPGYRINVAVKRDMILTPYKQKIR